MRRAILIGASAKGAKTISSNQHGNEIGRKRRPTLRTHRGQQSGRIKSAISEYGRDRIYLLSPSPMDDERIAALAKTLASR